MESSFCGSDILKLAELLKTPNEDNNFIPEQKVNITKPTSKADNLRPKIVRKAPVQQQQKKEEEEENVEKLEKEFLEKSADESDWRLTPEWDVTYKQVVTPNDVFLQMSNKTQLTSSCEEMIITIKLPDETGPGIDVKVMRDRLVLIASKHKLNIPLPHTVDPQEGNAKWDASKEQLILTLKMDREFDFINF